MKIFRSILLMGCAIMALAAAAQQSDPVIASINEAYRQAKESIKKNKDMGNEMTAFSILDFVTPAEVIEKIQESMEGR